MKIVCPNCGKKYNYEKSMGVCPSCTKYTSFVDVQKQISGVNPGYNTPKNDSPNYVSPPDFPYDDHHQHHKEDVEEDLSFGFGGPPSGQYQGDYQSQYYQDQQNYQDQYPSQYHVPRQPKSPVVIGIVLVFVLLMVASFVIATQVMAPAKINELNEYQLVSDVPLSTASIAEPIKIWDLTFTIEQPEVYESELFTAPEGWKYISIPFTSRREYNSMEYRHLEMFLNIDDMFVPPLSQYDIPEYDFSDTFISTQIEDLGIENSIWGQESGHLLFLVREDESEYTLAIYTFVHDYEIRVQRIEGKLEIAFKL